MDQLVELFQQNQGLVYLSLAVIGFFFVKKIFWKGTVASNRRLGGLLVVSGIASLFGVFHGMDQGVIPQSETIKGCSIGLFVVTLIEACTLIFIPMFWKSTEKLDFDGVRGSYPTVHRKIRPLSLIAIPMFVAVLLANVFSEPIFAALQPGANLKGLLEGSVVTLGFLSGICYFICLLFRYIDPDNIKVYNRTVK